MIDNSESKKRILILMGRYLPGYKDGGPVRTIKNLVDYLGNEYHFSILTCDRDHGDLEPYHNIVVNGWNMVGNAKVYYVPPKGFTFKILQELAQQSDLVYVCGCFNDYAIKTLFLKRIGKIQKPVVIAAMGLFSPMAFKLKYPKKKIFVVIFQILGMFKNIFWSATSELEIEEIKKQIKANDEQFFVAEDLPRVVNSTPIMKKKEVGELNIVWVSRIAPKKNLLGAIEILKKVKSEIKFTIYGFVHDKEYWRKCQKALEQLPLNIKWEYKGNIESEEVVDVLSNYHVFLFPTLGENYGHVIQEALSAGCPCIISDQTPWRELEERGIGYAYSLNHEDSYVKSIEKYAAMDAEEFNLISEKAIQYIVETSKNKVENTGYRTIFDLDEGK